MNAGISPLSDDEIETILHADVRDGERALARVIRRLMDIEERRIHLKAGYASVQEYCTKKLNISKSAASRRWTAVKVCKRFPEVLDALAEGRIHLVAIGLLKSAFTEENVSSVLERARGMGQYELEMLVAELRPRPDAPSIIRKYPERASKPDTLLKEVDPNAVASSPEGDGATTDPASDSTAAESAPPPPDSETRPIGGALNGRKRPLKPFEPLSPGRHKVQYTASDDQRAKLKYAIDLMSHSNPLGDLAPVIDAALDLLIAELEKKRFGLTDKPRPNAKPPKDPGDFSQSARREIVARDGGVQCAFVSEDGHRCTARAFAQFDHRGKPRAHLGTGDADNGQVLCGPHNRYMAELTFGREKVEAAIERNRREAAARKRDKVQAALREMNVDDERMAYALSVLDQTGWRGRWKDLLREAMALVSIESDEDKTPASNRDGSMRGRKRGAG